MKNISYCDICYLKTKVSERDYQHWDTEWDGRMVNCNSQLDTTRSPWKRALLLFRPHWIVSMSNRSCLDFQLTSEDIAH